MATSVMTDRAVYDSPASVMVEVNRNISSQTRQEIGEVSTLEMIPIYYNHPNGSAWHQGESIGFVNYVDLPHTPRYCFGHGLSYTDFVYSDLKISERGISPDGKVQIEAVILNAGEREGDEVVQLYLRDRFASMTRLVKELAGFKRVSLKPGEKKRVVFEVSASQTAFLDKDMRWRIEKGMIDVQIGSSSEDIRLTGEYEIKETGWVLGRDRAFYAGASVGCVRG